MRHDESSKKIDIKGLKLLQQLDEVFSQITETLQKSLEDIFEINQNCEKQCIQLETEIQEINQQIEQVIEIGNKYERLARQARLRLMEVSRLFDVTTEENIKNAYDTAQALQIKLQQARQQESFLKLRREEIENQIRQYRSIFKKAENLLNSTSIALKLMQSSADKLSDTIEQVNRKNQLELWIVETLEAERRKIARELHDGPAQSLASMLIRLDLIMRMIPEDDIHIRHELQNLKAIGTESLTDVRSIMYDLKPTLVHDQGLSNTFKDYFNELCEFNCIIFLDMGFI